MPNTIKYSTSSQTLALRKGEFWIGVGDVEKGPTNTTGYWNGITPPSGGYTIYLYKAANGPSIYCPANDSELIWITNSVLQSTFTTVTQALNGYTNNPDKMAVNRDYPTISTDGLVFIADAGFTPSYPRTGATWYDVSVNGALGTITGATYSSSNEGVLVFDAANSDRVLVPNDTPIDLTTSATVIVWVKFSSIGSDMAIVDKSDVTFPFSTFTYGYSLFVDSIGYPYFAIGTGSDSYSVYSTSILTPATWYQIAGTYNASTSTLNLYVNGSLVAGPVACSPGGNIASSSARSLLIGSASLVIKNFTDGSIAIVQIYNRDLSATEISSNYSATQGRF